MVVLANASELMADLPAWEALAADALEANPFYEPWMLLPALKAYGQEAVRCLLVYLRNPEKLSAPPVLSGLFPLAFSRHYRGIPIKTVRIWQYMHCFLCTPLLRAAHAQQCVSTFIDWLAASDRRLLELGAIPAEGPFYQLLVDQLHHRRMISFVADIHTRPVLRPRESGETYLQLALSSHRKRNLKRRAKRLAENGAKLEYQSLAGDPDLNRWVEEFLRLEASGWKGRQGSALACAQADEQFFRSVIQEASARGRLEMLALRLDGQPIAMKTMFRAGHSAFLFKPAYDETYARFSPGILLDAYTTGYIHELADLAWVDSCTTPGRSPLYELWLDRRMIQTLVISSGKAPGDLIVSSLPMLRWFWRRLRRHGAVSMEPRRGSAQTSNKEKDHVEQPPTIDASLGSSD